jgi:hypothetical protein
VTDHPSSAQAQENRTDYRDKHLPGPRAFGRNRPRVLGYRLDAHDPDAVDRFVAEDFVIVSAGNRG